MLIDRSAEDIVRFIAMEPQQLSIEKVKEQLARYKRICKKWAHDNSEHNEIVLKDDF